MVLIHKVVGVMACSFLLCLGLSNAAQAANAPAPSEAPKTITGELLCIAEGDYFVKMKDGKEVRMHADNTTQMIGQIKEGDSIEAKVNGRDHAMLIRQTQ